MIEDRRRDFCQIASYNGVVSLQELTLAGAWLLQQLLAVGYEGVQSPLEGDVESLQNIGQCCHKSLVRMTPIKMIEPPVLVP